MTDVTPIQQPPLEDLQNALQILQEVQRGILIIANESPQWDWSELLAGQKRAQELLRHALAQLGEIPLHVVALTLREMKANDCSYSGDDVRDARMARKLAAMVIDAQLRGAGLSHTEKRP
jgi:hypothetical protein